MTSSRGVPLQAVVFLVVLGLFALTIAVMLDPGILGGVGDVLRESGTAVDGNWVLLAAVLFPVLMFAILFGLWFAS